MIMHVLSVLDHCLHIEINGHAKCTRLNRYTGYTFTYGLLTWSDHLGHNSNVVLFRSRLGIDPLSQHLNGNNKFS